MLFNSGSGVLRAVGHFVAIAPLVWLLALVATGGLGVNPVEKLTHESGQWALILLLLSLLIRPVVQSAKLKKIMPWRRIFGLYAFFYALGHFAIYLVLDLSLDFSFLWDDLVERPYILVGFCAWLILLVLALTSPQSARRRLGRKWLTLHKSVYVAAGLVLLHYYWLIRADYAEYWWYLLAFMGLMLWRVGLARRKKNHH